MKRILIIGKNSYIGTSLEQWLKNFPKKYEIKSISLRDDSWEEEDFSVYDAVYHVSGIAHIKETEKIKDLYYRVNRDLTYEVAKKSKKEGVKQFIFLSTMSVYGLESGVINEDTPLRPKSDYGKSKLQAEELIKPLGDDDFKITIIRPPMVYGKGCKGNYPRLAKLAKMTPIFPYIDNKRSMIYIDSLSEFVRLLIDDSVSGLFLPQNKEYVNISEMVKLIAESHGKNLRLTKLFNWAIAIGLVLSETFRKVFGSLIYDKEMQGGPGILINKSDYLDYETFSFEESIRVTEYKEKF